MRPFTLLPPLVGMVSGSFTALGALAHREGRAAWEFLDGSVGLAILGGGVLAMALNAGSNALNQWTDLENDRINKPHRPLPAGRIGVRGTLAVAAVGYAVALGLAAAIRPEGRAHTLWVVLAGALLTLAYSCPPLRTKRSGSGANLTIAVTRGCLLKVAGWSCVAAVAPDPEPWAIGAVFALFLFGAAATKDFADLAGDRAAGCHTWPVQLGPARAARRVAPFLYLPWLLIPLGCLVPAAGRSALLTGNAVALVLLTAVLVVYGIHIARLMLRDPSALAQGENHPAWRHVYLQMLVAQVGLMVAYLV